MLRFAVAMVGALMAASVTTPSAYAQQTDCPALSIAGFEVKDGKQWTVNINLDAEDYVASLGASQRTASVEVTCTGNDIQIVQTKSSDGDDCTYALTRQGPARVGTSLTGIISCARAQAKLTNAKLAAASGPVALNDGRILYAIQAADNAAARFCAIVVGLAKREDVRNFAQIMMDDHNDLNKRIEQVAQQNNLKLKKSQISAALDELAEQKRRDLVRTPGDAVDRKFVDSEITFHRRMVQTFNQKLIPAAQSPKVKQFLTAARETFSKHEQHAVHTAPVLSIPVAATPAHSQPF
jgi:putative membrane protein